MVFLPFPIPCLDFLRIEKTNPKKVYELPFPELPGEGAVTTLSKKFSHRSHKALRGISIAPFGKRVQADGIPPKPSVTRRWAKGTAASCSLAG